MAEFRKICFSTRVFRRDYYAYLAEDLEKLAEPPKLDEDEDIEVLFFTPEELEKAILEGELVDSKSISSFMLARPYLN